MRPNFTPEGVNVLKIIVNKITANVIRIKFPAHLFVDAKLVKIKSSILINQRLRDCIRTDLGKNIN